MHVNLVFNWLPKPQRFLNVARKVLILPHKASSAEGLAL